MDESMKQPQNQHQVGFFYLLGQVRKVYVLTLRTNKSDKIGNLFNIINIIKFFLFRMR